ncbi:MAG: hypothetical protein NTZ80_00955, partial [Patescibacteria group bacterium]|nr:hypothetical protein [Patescibacteria group bacterium]
MKRIVLLTLLCIVVSFGSLNANEASKSSLTFSIIGSSNYVGNQGFTFLNKPVIIASCQYGYGNVYAGIAAVASPYEGFDSDGGDELDLYVGAKFKIGKLGILDLGYVYYGNSPFSLYVGDLHGIGGTFKMACG